MLKFQKTNVGGASSSRTKPRAPVDGLFCLYPHRECMQPRIEGYDFCTRHILEDKNSPYKQCTYMSNKTGKRCSAAAPKADKKDGYCPEHAKRAALTRARVNKRRRPRETPETLLEELDHYASRTNTDGQEVRRSRMSLENLAHRILEYGSSSDSESEPGLVDSYWRGDGDSDAESIDSENEDTLKHAGVYTAEEVALITRDKLIRLQSLYIDQFKRLQHVLKEKRRQYLHTLPQERDTLGGLHYAKEDPELRDTYDKLVCMKRYHRRYGKEALLHRQSKERRIAVSEGANYKPPYYPKCIYTEGGSKCSGRTVPLAKYCFQHLAQDVHQVLYRPCAFGDGACERLVLKKQRENCVLHSDLKEFFSRLPIKREPQEAAVRETVPRPVIVKEEVRDPSPMSDQTTCTTESATSSTPLPDSTEQSVSPPADPCLATEPASTATTESTDKPDTVSQDPVPTVSPATESLTHQAEVKPAEISAKPDKSPGETVAADAKVSTPTESETLSTKNDSTPNEPKSESSHTPMDQS